MTIALRTVLFTIFSFSTVLCYAQVPTISYITPQSYLAGNAVSLSPTGANVSAPAYGSAITIGSGFSIPASVTTDAAGNVYVVDVGNNTVTKIPAGGGAVVTISGIQPTGIAVDATGKIYITDSEDGLVEVYSSTGTFIQTYSGFSTPVAVAVDNTGNIYVADNAGGIIREISNGNNQIVVDGLTSITGIAVDAAGNLYIADGNYGLSKVAPETDNKVGFGSAIASPIQGVAIDPSGNIFLAETTVIQKVAPAGGAATSIHTGYTNATGVGVGPDGNVYVADRHNSSILGFKPVGGYYINAVPTGLTFNNTSGVISGTTTAASPATNYIVTAYNSSGSAKATVNITVSALTISYTSPHVYSAGAPVSLAPTSSKVAAPAYSNYLTTVTTFSNRSTAVTTDPSGNFYYYDPDNQSIYKVALVGGIPVKIASGYANVIGLAADGYGNVFMTQQSSSAVTEVPADGSPAVNIGPGFIVDSSPTSIYVKADGTVYTIDSGSLETLYPTRSGAANTGNISATAGIAIDASGNIYVGETDSVVEIMASGGSKVTVCSGFAPGGITIDGFGNIFITDITNNAIDEIPFGGTIRAVNYDITGPQIAADAAGNLFIGGSVDNTLKKLAPTGGYFSTPLPSGISISPSTGVISGTATVSTPATIYTITAYNGYGSKYTKVSLQFTPLTLSYSTPHTYNKGTAITPLTPTSSGVAAYRYAGSESYLGSGYGPGGQLALDAAGNIYTANGLVKKIPAGSNEGIPLGSGISEAFGVTVDPAGNVYVADYGNNRVVKILAADGSQQTLGLGFSEPYNIAVDSTGNVYVADYGNGVVKKMSSTGGVPTVVGTGISNPVAVAVDPAGNLYIGDSGLGYIVEVPVNGGPQVNIGSGLRFGNIGVDATGNIFVSDADDGAITEFPAGGGSAISLPFIAAEQGGIGIDGTGTIYRFNQTITIRKPVGGYFINQLPAGLSFNNTTGVLSGTPTASIAAKTYTITAWNSVGSNSTKVSIAIITNATLSALSLSAGTLTPAFAVGTASYTASVANSVSSITVTPTASLSTSTIKVNGTVVKSGSTSGAIALNVGVNTITTMVTAQDGVTTQTYTVKVTRAVSSNAALSNISLSKGTLSPAFAATTTSYTDMVTNGTVSVTLTPTTAESTSKVTVNGTAVSTGKASGAIALSVGSNTVTIIVTAPDGTTKNTYTVSVIRPSTNAKLSALAISAGALTPAFNSNTVTYTASETGGVSSITIKPTVAVAGATVTVNGTAVASGSASSPITLATDPNKITVIVTAQDGVTTDTYTLTVTKAAASTNNNLSALTISKGTLTPTFAVATISYSDMVSNGNPSVTVTPTVADATSAVTVNGAAVASGKASGAITLTVGSNTISTVVTAQSGAAKTYTITVIRPSTNAKLSALIISSGTLTPAFNTNTVSYTDAVANATSSIKITPTVAVTGATAKVNGSAVASGNTSAAISLATGPNTITTVVTAQDGVTTGTYTITVTRAAATENIPDAALGVGAQDFDPLPIPDDGITVHQGLSPNGDGINDFLQIDNISQYPDNKLVIMNRNGQLVYEAKGYSNSTRPFDGHSNKNGQMQLPGTYFYSLDYTVKGVVKHKRGFLVLKY